MSNTTASRDFRGVDFSDDGIAILRKINTSHIWCGIRAKNHAWFWLATHGFGWPHMVLKGHTWCRKDRKLQDACDNVSPALCDKVSACATKFFRMGEKISEWIVTNILVRRKLWSRTKIFGKNWSGRTNIIWKFWSG